jgi:RHS repeat-associated protein
LSGIDTQGQTTDGIKNKADNIIHFNAASQNYQSYIKTSSTASGDLSALAANQVYWFKLKSEDISYPFTWRSKAQSDADENLASSHVRLLQAGWNQTSLPLDAAITNDGDIERYLKGTSIERIWYYQQSQDRWYTYYKNRADQSTLTELKPDAVYWVLSSREQILTAANGSESGISSQKAYLHNNHLGSVAFETDESGAVSQASLYQPYGASSKDSNKASQKVSTYSFSGKEEDGSGLYYFEARYYDPVTTRFVSPDPLFAVDMEKCIESIIECNLYQYTGNNPVVRVDPYGEAVHVIAGAMVGAVFSTVSYGIDIYNGEKFNIVTALGKTANGAVVGAVTAANPAAGLLRLAGKATGAGFVGGVVDDMASNDKLLPDMESIVKGGVSGIGNAVELGAGEVIGGFAKAIATTTKPAVKTVPYMSVRPNNPVVSHWVDDPASKSVDPFTQQIVQDSVGGLSNAIISPPINEMVGDANGNK